MTKTNYRKWQKRLVKKLPDIVDRVFALRGKVYNGYGFQRNLEYQIGKIITIVCDSPHKIGLELEIYNEVFVGLFFEQLVAAEKSVEEHSKETK